ncbi:hypothetical protein ISS86_00775 [Candidatus Microgenomates bacterium]|nr:hypothetical protein [Candidatus Microgenomates bacterium]
MKFDEDYKDKIGAQLTRRLGEALRDGKIVKEEVSIIAAYILDNIDNVSDRSQLFEFLSKLSQKWPFFSDILTVEKTKELEENKEGKVEEVTKLIKEKKVDEAINAAEVFVEKKTEEKKKEK